MVIVVSDVYHYLRFFVSVDVHGEMIIYVIEGVEDRQCLCIYFFLLMFLFIDLNMVGN